MEEKWVKFAEEDEIYITRQDSGSIQAEKMSRELVKRIMDPD